MEARRNNLLKKYELKTKLMASKEEEAEARQAEVQDLRRLDLIAQEKLKNEHEKAIIWNKF